MKLRSGRVIHYIPKVSYRQMRTLNENFQKLQISDSEQCKVLKESKTLFRFIFYKAFIYFCKKAKLEEIGKSQGQKPVFFETSKWSIDETFLKETFEQGSILMRQNSSSGFYLHAFYYFIKNEHPKQLENPDGFARLNNLVGRYLQKLFYQNSYERMLRLMQEQEQIKTRAFPLADKKVYFMEMADFIADSRVLYHEHLQPLNFQRIFDDIKQTIAHIEVEHGYTIVKSPCVGFSCPPSYFFNIAETRERFSSLESNPRKAFLLNRRLQGF